jgi:hypothetical protein
MWLGCCVLDCCCAHTERTQSVAVQEDIVKMLGSGYNPLVKGFKSAREHLQATNKKTVSSSLEALRRQVAQEEREVAELAKQVRSKGKGLAIATSLNTDAVRGGDDGQKSPPTPEVLRRLVEDPSSDTSTTRRTLATDTVVEEGEDEGTAGLLGAG